MDSLSRIDRQFVDITVAATLADGTATTISGVDAALLPPRKTPTSSTPWTAADWAAPTASVLVAGPDADSTGALVVPLGGADLWVRVTDAPEVTARRVARISVA